VSIVINHFFFPERFFYSENLSLANQGLGGMLVGVVLGTFPYWNIFNKENESADNKEK